MTNIPEHLEPEHLGASSPENPPAIIQNNDESEQRDLEYNRYKLESEKQKLEYTGGSIGKWLGQNQEKAGNIAGLSILASFILVFCIIVIPTNNEESKHRFLLIPSGIITLSLGYIFGKR